ncbi:S8 family serine peptidase [Erythrobacter sp. BLCC-B19]|uniref:S8 family serine peptidase n=1 Tax=Erythrobacter sp. BLCC-B19 TaxID=3025315 RepID=UPI0023622AC9|nr:S8 family serine peptidase [Erythrobacter sp. BLCC-B19]WDA41735.1 hypothetical protein PS060_02720 [Erythrobacter sp. BLCC-B19]
MAVGFAPGAPNPIPVTAAQPHDKPNEPWELRFSRFVNEGGETGAHNLTGGVGQRGAGITIAHLDTGYTLHPELMHGGRVRTQDARTFTDPAPSYLSLKNLPSYLEQTLNVHIGAGIVVTSNSVQITAGASARVVFPDNGIDMLLGLNPSHGCSTASLFMSPVAVPPATNPGNNPPQYPVTAPQVAEGLGANRIDIIGTAPEAQYLPVRVTDSVMVDPIVANNMATGLRYILDKAKTDSSIGVISISLGMAAGEALKYAVIEQAIGAVADAGIIVCAAAGQTVEGHHSLFEGWAQTAESLAGTANQGSAAAQEAARVARIVEVVADFTGLALGSSYPTMKALCDDLVAKAKAAGRSAQEIARYLRFLELLLANEARAARIIGGPAYPGSDINTICCAACDVHGNPLNTGLYGIEVDITSPGVQTFSARSVLNGQGGVDHFVHRSDGTSYATAITAGACALWQAHHGRQNLITRFGKHLMVHAFRWALKHSAATQTVTGAQAPWDAARRGFGMLDAAALLQVQLPANANLLIEALHNEGVIDVVTRARLRTLSNLN